MIDLQPRQKQIVREILLQHVPEELVYVFGSRANCNAKPHSDLDLVLVGKESIPIQRLHLLEEAFAESELSFRVDVLDWNAISEEFRRQIEKTMQALNE